MKLEGNLKEITMAVAPKLIGWMVSWTETEAGWGSRPDGIHIYATSEKAVEQTAIELQDMRKREAKIYKGQTPSEYSYPDNPTEPKMIRITPEIAKEIEERGRAIRHLPPYNPDGTPCPYYSNFHKNETF
jgi:hypothetical protein